MKLTVTTALPYEHRERATAGLRGQLRLVAIGTGATPDWMTLQVTGPRTTVDGRGRTWFEWAATVDAGTA